MGSTGKKRTTMAKLNRESNLRNKRAEKQARKAARRETAEGAATGLGSTIEEQEVPWPVGESEADPAAAGAQRNGDGADAPSDSA